LVYRVTSSLDPLHDAVVLRMAGVFILGAATALLTGCSSPSTLSDLASYSVGPPGHRVQIAAASELRPHTSVAGGTSVGTAVLPGAVDYTTVLALPGNGRVRVSISVPPGAVAPAHARWIINSYFNNTPERLTTWHGEPADEGVRPCSTPAGACPGYLGGFQVFQDGSLYNVTIASGSSDTAWAVIDSIRIPRAG
jgi:hypothetical protein